MAMPGPKAKKWKTEGSRYGASTLWDKRVRDKDGKPRSPKMKRGCKTKR